MAITPVSVCLSRPPQPSRVIALCLYRDVSGLFTTESRSARDEPAPPRTHPEVETLIQDIGWVLGQVPGWMGVSPW